MRVLLILSICIFFVDSQLTVISPPAVCGEYEAGKLVNDGIHFTQQGRLVIAEPINTCSDLTDDKQKEIAALVQNNVTVALLFQHSLKCTVWKQIEIAQNIIGVVAFIWERENGYVGQTEVTISGDVASFPALEVSPHTSNKLQDEVDNVVIVELQDPKENPFISIVYGPGGIFVSVIFGITDILTISVAIYKLVAFVKEKLQITFPIISLCLALIVTILQLVLSIDPVNSGRFVTSGAYSAFNRFYIFLWMTSVFVMTFYWQEALNNTKMTSIQLVKMKIPATIILVTWWSIFVVLITITALGYRYPGVILNACAIAMAQIFGLYFIYTAIRVFTNVRNAGKAIGKTHNRITILVLTMGITITCLIALSIMTSTPMYEISVHECFVLDVLEKTCLHVVTASQIFVFQAPNVSNWFCLSTNTTNESEIQTNTSKVTME